jgi:glyoxylase-like metal-dependent hydrolase (beta-lactamase superfamily II)
MAISRRMKIVAAVAVGVGTLVGGALVVVRLKQDGVEPSVAVAPGILRVRNFFADVYGARAGGGVVLFDAGVDSGGAPVDALATALGGLRADVKDIYLTHGHFDHVAGAAACPGARVHAGAGDVALAARTETSPKPMVRLLQSIWPVAPVTVTHPLAGTVTDAVTGVVAYPMPGHTPGSYAYWLGGVLFAGDSIHIEGDRLEGAAPPFTTDLAENARSIVALARALGGARLDFVCTGHEACTPPGRARAMLDELAARSAAAGAR